MTSYMVTGVHAAARAGKTAKVVDYISKGGDVNKLDREKCSPLMWACWGGHLEIVTKLLEHGAQPNVFNEQRASSLHWASWGGHLDIVRILLTYNVPLDDADDQDGAPLHYAAKKGFLPLAEMLVAAGADVDAPNTKQMTPLHLACHVNKTDVAALLLANKAGVNVQDYLLRTPLHYACLKAHTEAVQMLLAAKADVSVADDKGKTALHLVGQSASRKDKGNADAIAALLREHGAIDKVFDSVMDATTPLASPAPPPPGSRGGSPASARGNPAPAATASAAAPAGAAAAEIPVIRLDLRGGPLEGTGREGGDGDSKQSWRRPTAAGEADSRGDGRATEELASPRTVAALSAAQRKATATAGGSPRRMAAARAAGSSGGGPIPAPSPSGLPSRGGDPLSNSEHRARRSSIKFILNGGQLNVESEPPTAVASPERRRGSEHSHSLSRSVGALAGSGGGGGAARSASSDADGGDIDDNEMVVEMALEQIITDLADMEERVQTLAVDQKANEEVMLEALKRVDEMERDVRKVKKQVNGAAAGGAEAGGKQAGRGRGSDSSVGSQLAALQETVEELSRRVNALTGKGSRSSSSGSDASGSSSLHPGMGSPRASQRELKEVSRTVRIKEKESQEMAGKVEDAWAELETFRKANKNLRERVDEREVEMHRLEERVKGLEKLIAAAKAAGNAGCSCSVM